MLEDGARRYAEVTEARVRQAPPWSPIVVGEAPSRSSDPLRPLVSGQSGRFLARLAGLELFRFDWLFRCVNLLPYVPREARPKRRALALAGAQLRPALWGRRVITLGRLVSDACGVTGPVLEWHEPRGGYDALALPHPSGINRSWTPELRARVSALLRAEAARAAEGARLDLPPGVVWPWLERVVAGA